MRIAIVVPCTASKRADPGHLRLGQVAGTEMSVSARFRSWRKAIAGSARLHIARDLYAGPRWEASLRIADAAGLDRRRRVELFVASAGLGLVEASEMVPSYSATFSPGGPDSVAPSHLRGSAARQASREWWGLLGRDRRTFADVAGGFDRMIVALSPAYLDALEEDLVHAARGTSTLVFATVAPRNPSLASSWVRVGRHLRETTPMRPEPVIRGTDATLLQATAAKLVAMPLGRWATAAMTQELLDALADPVEPTIEAQARAGRLPATDEEVREFVRRARAVPGSPSSDRLLELWRGPENRRCAVDRFKRLVAEVEQELAAGGRDDG
jgi:hypothetical protein